MEAETERSIDARRDRIADAATTHFLADGFDGASLDRVAATAKVGKQTIYECFASKDELFAYVVTREAKRNVLGDLPPDGDPQSTLEAHGAEIARRFCAPRNFGLLRANLFAAKRFPHLASSMHRAHRENSRPLADYIERLVREARIAPLASNPLDVATRFGSLVSGGSRFFLGYPPPSADGLIADLGLTSRFFLHGYRVRSPAPDEARVAADAVPSGVGPKRRLRIERFDALCAHAADEFLARGFLGSSLAPIITDSGVGRATIYRQFGSKDGLFRYVMGQEIDRIGEQTLKTPTAADLRSGIANLARAALDLHLEERSLALHYLLIQEAQAFPELARAFYDAQVARLAAPISALLTDAGLSRPGPSELRMFHTLATFGLRFIAMSEPVDGAQRERASHEVARLMVHGLENP